jgi:hypothetical protein
MCASQPTNTNLPTISNHCFKLPCTITINQARCRKSQCYSLPWFDSIPRDDLLDSVDDEPPHDHLRACCCIDMTHKVQRCGQQLWQIDNDVRAYESRFICIPAVMLTTTLSSRHVWSSYCLPQTVVHATDAVVIPADYYGD